MQAVKSVLFDSNLIKDKKLNQVNASFMSVSTEQGRKNTSQGSVLGRQMIMTTMAGEGTERRGFVLKSAHSNLG